MPGLSDLLDSDMEGTNFIDENSIISTASEATVLAPGAKGSIAPKKPRKRKCVTVPKKSRVTKTTSSPVPTSKGTTKKLTGAKRKALEENINSETIPDSQDRNDEDVEETEPQTKPKGRSAPKLKLVPTIECSENEGSVTARSHHAQMKTTKPAPKTIKAQTKQRRPKALTAPEENDPQVESEIDEVMIAQQPPPKRARTESRTRHQEPAYRRRAGSASDTERGDPNLRRKLGDVTRKFENVDLKYRNLKEVGIAEANANVEKLRKQCEATTEASSKLIASLQKELALQVPLTQEARKFKKESEAQQTELSQLRGVNAELSSSLTSVQNELKVVQAKLAAMRSTPAVADSTSLKTPGSVMKSRGPTRTVMVGSAEAAQAAEIAQLKLDLYGDLTGLIIRSVKRAEDGDTYDCIQTGRNGTLHFKLFIDQEEAKNGSFEETEFLYTPLLDLNRDRDMMDLMPAYLTEDITFARQNAAKFYGRVVETLTKRREEE